MRKFKFISSGCPDPGHMKIAIKLAKENCVNMSIGDEITFGFECKTLVTINKNNNVVVYLINDTIPSHPIPLY